MVHTGAVTHESGVLKPSRRHGARKDLRALAEGTHRTRSSARTLAAISRLHHWLWWLVARLRLMETCRKTLPNCFSDKKEGGALICCGGARAGST
jgi:hypothetical protein